MSDKTKIFLEESQARFQQKTNQKMLSNRRKEKTRRKKRDRTYFAIGRVICEHIPNLIELDDITLDQTLDKLLDSPELLQAFSTIEKKVQRQE